LRQFFWSAANDRALTSWLRTLQLSRCCAVPTSEIVDIKAADPAVLDHPLSADHDPIRLVSAAQY
jgi:hypothetical protein